MMRALLASMAALTVVTVLLELSPRPAASQTPAGTTKTEAGAKPGPVPKTSWGEPDLQGIWTNDYDTPLQRPAWYADKESLSDEERAALDGQRAGILGRFSQETIESRRGRGTERGEQFGAYRAEIFKTEKHDGPRTWMI